jgi:uncharacterized protein YcbX
MTIEIGHISAIFRYPVKSMAGQPGDTARLGWHGLDGDRRFAFRRLAEAGGFPWLTAGRMPELILYRPVGRDEGADEPLPTHVVTPEGEELELRGPELREHVSRRFGGDVEIMRLNHGVFDEAHLSVISLTTVGAVEREAGLALDVRRFRPNVVVETPEGEPFCEDAWVGGTLVFGPPESGAAVAVTMRDLRCMMLNLDPDTARQDPAMMKAAVRMNQNNAGVYGAVVRTGELEVGQRVWLRRE